MAKILLLIAQEGFQTKEYGDPKRILVEARHTVVTASRDGGIARSNIGEEIATDLKLSDVRTADYDAVYAIGGPGALAYLDNEDTVRIMREAKEGNVFYGAICIAPRILARAGLLRGTRITGWNQDDKLGALCEDGGCVYEEENVVHDGRVITANGPLAAEEFGETICAALATNK